MKLLKKWWPLLVVVVIVAAIYFSGIWRWVSFESIKTNKEAIEAFVQKHPVWAPVVFIGVYFLVAALCIPGASLLTLLAGFLWPQPWGALFVIIGATLGATTLFVIAKTILKRFLSQRAKPFLSKLKAGFEKNQISYMLFLRFVAIFPFWVVNLAPAFFNVPVYHYVWTTLVGIIPGTFVFAQAGRGLNRIFASNEGFTIGSIFNWEVRIALIGLAIISLIPILVKKIWKKKHDR